MALYSWFLRKNSKPIKKSVNNEVLRASTSVNNIENYTMWPTAKIKPNADVVPPSFNHVDNNTLAKTTIVLPTKTVLTVIK